MWPFKKQPKRMPSPKDDKDKKEKKGLSLNEALDAIRERKKKQQKILDEL